jgi:aspartate aminotransferase
MYSEQFIADIVKFCERKGIWVLMDDIYHKLIFDGRHIISAYKYTDHDLESSKVIVINGIAKVYGMTGYRIGWAIAPRELVQIMTNVQAQTTSCVSLILQAGAEGALNGVQSVVEALRLQIQNNRDIVMSELASFTGVRTQKPDGTFYCLPDFRAYSNDSVKLSEFFLKKALVVTVPGKEFGMEGHLRLSYSGTVKDVTEGLARMKWALDPNSANEIYIGDKKMVRDWL